METNVLIEYYNNIATYLMATFGANFIFITVLVTTMASIAYFIVISYIITQLDTRYFLRNDLVRRHLDHKSIANHKTSAKNSNESPVLMSINSGTIFLVNLVKIIFGVCLLVCGLAMLVLPGQGLITILIGLSLIPFPGKHKLEQSLLERKSVRLSLNWIRLKAKKEPFIFD